MDSLSLVRQHPRQRDTFPVALLQRHFGSRTSYFAIGDPFVEFSMRAAPGAGELPCVPVPGATVVKMVRFLRNRVIFTGSIVNGYVRCPIPVLARSIANHSAKTIQRAYRHFILRG